MISIKVLTQLLKLSIIYLVFERASSSNFSIKSTNSGFVYRSYQTSIYCHASSPIKYPRNVEELQEIVNGAIREGKTIKALGSRHSITDIICTEGLPISMKYIDHSIDNGDDTFTFGSGIEIQDAMIFLQQHGKTLIHIPAFAGITLGGAIATGAHGSSLLHYTSISDQILSFLIIDGKGRLRYITEPNELNAFRVNLGLLGIICEVTIKSVPLFKMKISNTLHSEQMMFDGTALELAKSHDWFQFWWFPSLKDIVISKGTYLEDVNEPGNAKTNLIPEIPLVIAQSAKAGIEILQATGNKLALRLLESFTKLSLITRVVGKPPIFEEETSPPLNIFRYLDTFRNPATGYAWKLQSNKCKQCAWDSENPSDFELLPEESSIAFDISKFYDVIKMIYKVLNMYPAAFNLIGVFIRFSKASEGLLSIANGRTTFTVEWTTAMRKNRYSTCKDAIGAYQWILQEMVENYGGRPHWGKNGLHYLNKEILANVLPNREVFIQNMKKFDPNGIFLNKFGERLLGLSNEMDIDPKVTHCAIQDYCICKKDEDCGLKNQCVIMGGFNICKEESMILNNK